MGIESREKRSWASTTTPLTVALRRAETDFRNAAGKAYSKGDDAHASELRGVAEKIEGWLKEAEDFPSIAMTGNVMHRVTK